MNDYLQAFNTELPLILSQLHFVRPDWFYAFIPFLAYLLLASRQRLNSRSWQKIIDPQLAPFVLTQNRYKQKRYPLLLVLLAGSLCITALAGPVYKKLPQPVYREQSSLVVLLDLSQSMNATDIKPSRLARARLELLDILKSRKTGQTALIVYAADAFVVTPLTDDNATIANLVPSLDTSMMPAQGSNLSAALAKANELLNQAGVFRGNILVITDDIHERDRAAIEKTAAQGHHVSIFGIGTAQGGPVPLADGGFLHDSKGAIVIPKLDAGKLQRYAMLGGGLYTSLAADDSDINKLVKLFETKSIKRDEETEKQNQDLQADIWREEGHWLLLPLLLLAALWARRGWLAVILVFLLPLPQPVMADTQANTQAGTAQPASKQTAPLIDTDHLWLKPDQKAMRAFNKGDMDTATREFTRPEWKASALYRKGEYEAAAKALEGIDTADAWYNRGNALAKAGKLQEAIKAYDRALELNKNNSDAKDNRELVKQALEKMKQQQQNQNGQPQDKQKADSQKQDNQNGDNQQNNQQNEQQQGEQQGEQGQKEQNQQGQNQDQQSQNKGEQEPNDQQKNDQQGQQQNPQDSEQQENAQNNAEQQNDEQKSSDQKNSEQKTAEQQAAEEKELKQRDAQKEAEQQQKEIDEYRKQQAEQQSKQDKNNEQQQNSQQSDEIENREKESENEKPAEVEVNPVERSITEEEKATEQWLKRIPDDPGGLLRRKFYYQYQQIPNQHDEEEPW